MFFVFALSETQELNSLARDDVSDLSHPADRSPVLVVDSSSRCIALGFCDSFVKLAAIDATGRIKFIFKERTHLLHVFDVNFLKDKTPCPV